MLGAETHPRAGDRQAAMRAALARLGIDRLVVSIHQASFPAGDDDIGYGTPYSSHSEALIGFLAGLGVTGVALGPAGVTSRSDPSPYTGSSLSENPLHVALGPLVASGLLDERLLAEAVSSRPAGDLVTYAHAWDAQRRLLEAAAARAMADPELAARRARMRADAPWIEIEARFEAISLALGHDDWRRWPDDPPAAAPAGDAFELAQLLAADQHRALRQRAGARGVAILGDMAAGMGNRDLWVLPRVFGDLFLPGWELGAPPSRTNPDGQAWAFPVLDPRQLPREANGAARRFVTARFDMLLSRHDGLRVDHPHGWICPWVYRPDQPVAAGARLHESPDLPDLAPFARVRVDQLDTSRARHEDDWVRDLAPEQVDRYAVAIDLLVERARAHGADPAALMVEVLSTCPRPLAAVLARHGLGRFRVTQKADVDNPADVYRGDRAAPADWVMVGNHDTSPLRAVIARWRGSQELSRRAAYLAARIRRPAGDLERDERALATAMMAELFLGPARNVLVFWPDLFGLIEPFNRPGVVSEENWCLRIPADFESAHHRAVTGGVAPDLGQAVAWALEARDLAGDEEGRALARRLVG